MKWLLSLLLVGLVGCSTTQTQVPVQVAEFEYKPSPVLTQHKPLAEVQHFSTTEQVRTVTIVWKTVPKEKLQEICKRITNKSLSKQQNFLGCAAKTPAGVCVIHTDVNTSHQILGHEVRHCYDGAFHP